MHERPMQQISVLHPTNVVEQSIMTARCSITSGSRGQGVQEGDVWVESAGCPGRAGGRGD